MGIWQEVFGNPNPVEVEIGPGRGAFLFYVAAKYPDTNYYAIEKATGQAAQIQREIDRRRVPNARAICADAACVIRHLIPAESVSCYHIYFPDPWWKRRHHRRRVLTPRLAHDLEATLVANGKIFLATDVPQVFDLMKHTMGALPRLEERKDISSPRAVRTAFEHKGILVGSSILETTYVKH